MPADCQLPVDRPPLRPLQRLRPAHHPARAVAGGAEGLGHGLVGALADERGRAHVAGDEHRLPDRPVVGRHLGPAGAERPRGALAVHAGLRPSAPSTSWVSSLAMLWATSYTRRRFSSLGEMRSA